MTARVVAEPVIQIEGGQETATVIFDDGVVCTLPVVKETNVADWESVQKSFLEVIETHLKRPTSSTAILQLAEAYAWVMNPNQPHGGGEAPKG